MTGAAVKVVVTHSEVVVIRVGGTVILLINTVPVGRSLDAGLTRHAAELAVARVTG